MTRQIRILDAVSHERLDDEVIAINLETGAYFAFEGAAAECWTTADVGGSDEDITELLCAMFDVDRHTAAVDVGTFFDALVEHRLAQEGGHTSPGLAATRVGRTVDVRRPYVAPVVEAYDDLETLLLIDPIHEVDDAGWPLPAPDVV
jgi:hypothetical protein